MYWYLWQMDGVHIHLRVERMTKKYKNYGRGVGQFREEHGRATTYLTFLICALLLSAYSMLPIGLA